MSVLEIEYRYITQSPDVCGGRPIIKGTRTPVRTIAGYYKMGLSVEEILEGLPHLTPAQIHEALSYYYDHVDEIEQDIAANRASEVLARKGLSVTADGRIVTP
jgi:uncharacterized protein (DUF433 family)